MEDMPTHYKQDNFNKSIVCKTNMIYKTEDFMFRLDYMAVIKISVHTKTLFDTVDTFNNASIVITAL